MRVLTRLRLPAAGLGLALASGSCAAAPDAAEATVPLRIELRARSLTPGEPVRVEVRSPEPLVRLAGRFLDDDVFLARHAGDERWSGWTMIPLDRRAGVVAVEVHGETGGGREARGTLAVAIGHKEFPEERLEVESRYVTPPEEVQRRLAEERRVLVEIYGSRSSTPPPAAPFVRPVPGVQTSVFGTRRILNGKPRDPHPGIDLRAAEGTPVRAAGPGRVALARDLYYSGNTVILDHGGGLFTLYAHLSRIDVEEGAAIPAGVLVGLSGASGRVTGPHLHWGAKIGDRPFDPAALLDPALFHEPPAATATREPPAPG